MSLGSGRGLSLELGDFLLGLEAPERRLHRGRGGVLLLPLPVLHLARGELEEHRLLLLPLAHAKLAFARRLLVREDVLIPLSLFGELLARLKAAEARLELGRRLVLHVVGERRCQH